jgi:putative DNA primase/helicase
MLLSAPQLMALHLEQRPPVLGAFLREGDLGYLFAPRGAGKSWLAMLMARAIANSEALGIWQAGDRPREVIYFDAEMNLADVQERARKLCIASERFHWLSNERLFQGGLRGVNIADVTHQAALSDMLPDGCVFIIDNLSTAQVGMDENDNNAFDALRDWLLSLRHRRITVLIVHHAGRNGNMRGASRREDMAHWIISLKDASADDGAVKVLTTAFTKVRNCQGSDAPPLKWTLKDEGETLAIECAVHVGTDALLSHIQEGISSATELAEALGVSTGTVSKWAKKLITAGRIEKHGREYRVVEWPV